VSVFGGNYDAVQKKLYRDSLLAGYTKEEIAALCAGAGLGGCSIKRRFITHIDIIKRAANGSRKSAFSAPPGHGLREIMMRKFYAAKPRREKKVLVGCG